MSSFVVKVLRWAGIGEAPSDDEYYARRNGSWEPAPGAAGGEINTLADQGTGAGTLAGTKVGPVLGVKTIAAGENITVTNGADEITIASSASSGSALEVADEGVSLDLAVTKLNFLGSGVSAVENADHEIDITVAGGAAPVDSVFGRTGNVTAQANDYNATQIANFDTEVGNHTDVAANTTARHAESHTVASHSDTTATGPELNELTDGSETTLHSHAAATGATGSFTSFDNKTITVVNGVITAIVGI